MDLNKTECIDLLKTLGRSQRPGCEATLVLTESQAQSIIKALSLEEDKPKRGRPKKDIGETFGKTPE